jgi:hypothetical protein
VKFSNRTELIFSIGLFSCVTAWRVRLTEQLSTLLAIFQAQSVVGFAKFN